MSQANRTSTHDLFRAAHEALCSGQWVAARGLLDTLAGRADNVDMLPSAINYDAPAAFRDVLQSRIDACNATADRRLTERLEALQLENNAASRLVERQWADLSTAEVNRLRSHDAPSVCRMAVLELQYRANRAR